MVVCFVRAEQVTGWGSAATELPPPSSVSLRFILFLVLLPTPTVSVGVGRILSPSVCLFVRSITQNRMNPKISNLV